MKAGIIIESLGMSQKAYEIIKQMNQIEFLDEYWDIIVFYLEYDRFIITPNFSTMNVSEAFGMDSPLISTSIETTKISSNCLRATKRFFYVFDLEWTMGDYNIDDLFRVYKNPDIELIARSQDHAKIIKQCWKEPIAVIENFNYEQITKIISQ
jgi:hypothetical protein